jgi:endonuclease/exonuclease/phosphatase (EEP) superfamily protein YafD
MSLPLPLELTKPVLLAGDLNTQLRNAVTSTYDAKTQLSSSTTSSVQSQSFSPTGFLIDVVADVNVDDVLA